MTTNNNSNRSQQKQAAATVAHINPFYIDPGELEKDWQQGEDDYEWEDEYEAEGLMRNSISNDAENGSQHEHNRSRSSSPRGSSFAASKKKDSSRASASKNSRQQQLQLPHVKGVRLGRGQKRWICIIGFFALVIFFILSSTDSNSDTNNNDTNTADIHNHNNNGDGETAEAKSSIDENQHDNNNINNNDADMNTIDDAVDDEPPPGGSYNNNNNNNNEPSVSYVHRVVMLGERQTGVDAFRKHWADCFPNRNFTTYLTRKTFWFQDLTHPPEAIVAASKSPYNERILFVLLVRNPYTWVESMRGHPLYMSAHVNQTTHKALSWQDFVTRPWMPLTSNNIESSTDNNNIAATTTTPCQLDFAPNQVLPCHVSEDNNVDDAHPADVYELKPAVAGGVDGDDVGGGDLVFANILALRAAKLQHFISDLPRAYQNFDLMATLPLKSSKRPPMQETSTSLIDNNVLIVHYEDDLVLSMQKLEQVTGWKPLEACRQAKRFPPSITLENLDPEYIQFLSQDSDDTGLYWELETLIGYQKAAL
jgi:hypothetical protein